MLGSSSGLDEVPPFDISRSLAHPVFFPPYVRSFPPFIHSRSSFSFAWVSSSITSPTPHRHPSPPPLHVFPSHYIPLYPHNYLCPERFPLVSDLPVPPPRVRFLFFFLSSPSYSSSSPRLPIPLPLLFFLLLVLSPFLLLFILFFLVVVLLLRHSFIY